MSSVQDDNMSILFLKRNHVTFDPPDRKISIFFDECNSDVITIYNNDHGKTRVVFRNTLTLFELELHIPVQKRILSIKLNRARTILSYHFEKSIVVFINVNKISHCDVEGSPAYFLDDHKYSQNCRTRNSKLLGFIWTSSTEIVIITDISVEFYSVDAQRRKTRHIKTYQSTTNWFVYQPVNRQDLMTSECQSFSVLMISTGFVGNSIQPFLFTSGQVSKLEKFVVEGDWNDSNNVELFEHSITIAHIYGKVRLLVLQNESLNTKSKGAQVLVYTVSQVTGQTNRTHTLDLNQNGRFALNVIDNLIVAHDQPSKTSFIFDIHSEATERSDCPGHLLNIGGNQTMQAPDDQDQSNKRFDMYSADWVFFQPNFIIDVRRGTLCTLHLDLKRMSNFIQDKNLLLDFLSLRDNSDLLILSIFSKLLSDSTLVTSPNDHKRYQSTLLADVSSCLGIIQRLIISDGSIGQTSRKIDDSRVKRNLFDEVISYRQSISQDNFYKACFKQLESGVNSQFVIATFLEYIYILRKVNKDVDLQIYEQLVLALFEAGRFHQLIQMIRSGIIIDSKRVGYLLMSLKTEWPPAIDLGKDMLQRLNCQL